ncbi:hypothetical protein EFK50_05475 [Nocardioides marmoriginsengisoli]|uniref:Uncharacterized protein n=1 Tax=Nocardioides marmoriginsengisoli TaxID=661483 RepID=A0A3N0CQU8_9ACTN|nr:hypothetical protein [Nocardioides marmoriginsengisoli]RNL65406.1 hypothetical protein EFK50_05475 [Nocardioides marmoriginsengisoli]
MGKHSGDPVEEEQLPPDRRRLLKLAAGITATIVAWGFLVAEAIDFGSQGRSGQGEAWVFAFFATLGATACMFVTLILVNKVLATLRGEVRVKTVSVPGRRAAR